MEEASTIEVVVRGRPLRTTAAFQSYWRLAAERQRIFFRRVAGQSPPWTDDPVLAAHRFTNAYRASDRVSQFLINHVIYAGSTDAESTVLRILLFKIFNRIETWQYLEESVGTINVDTFDGTRFSQLLDRRKSAGAQLYSAAYIMPSPRLGARSKHANHIRLLQLLVDDGTVEALTRAKSLKELYTRLARVHSFGPFLAFQFAIDINYSDIHSFSEMDFVVAGPGARDGIAKCFVDPSAVAAEDIIRAVTEGAQGYATAVGASVESLWGRPLQLIDCQNLFCEVDKYARVMHPELAARSGRTRIKRRYVPDPAPLRVAYPPKWRLSCINSPVPDAVGGM